MFIQIRGTFGAGKTTLVKGFMERLKKLGAKETMIHHCDVDFAHEFRKTGLFKNDKPVLVIGRYNANACSGADCLAWSGVQDDIHAFLKSKVATHHILLEGTMSHSARHIEGALSFKARGIPSRFFSMDTPIEEAKKRIMGRRRKKWLENGKKGKIAPLNPVSMTGHFKVVEALHRKTLAAGLRCDFIDSEKKSMDTLVALVTK